MSISSPAAFAIAFILISTGVSISRAREVPEPSQISASPKWRTDLRGVLGTTPLGLTVGNGRETTGKPRVSIWFLNNEKVVATFITREGDSRLSTSRNKNETSSTRLRAIFLNASTGEVTSTINWPTESRFAGIVAVDSGKFVTETGTHLTLFSSGLAPEKTLNLSATSENGWASYPSPTGKNVLFIPSGLSGSIKPWILINTANLKVTRSWQDVHTGWVAISDSWIAMTACGWISHCEPFVEVRGPGTEWNEVSSASRPNNVPRPHFVDERTLLLQGMPTKLVDVDAQAKWSANLVHEACWWGGVYSASEAARFVVPSCSLRSHVGAIDVDGVEILKSFLIYDAPFEGPSPTHILNLQGPTIKGLPYLALSPDGSRIAILDGEAIELVGLPGA